MEYSSPKRLGFKGTIVRSEVLNNCNFWTYWTIGLTIFLKIKAHPEWKLFKHLSSLI